MHITFVPTKEPFVRNDVTTWHAEHGWCWNVDVDDMFVATLFCTLLCGDGCLVHFDTGKYIRLPGPVILAIMRKAMRMLEQNADVIYATILARNHALIRVAIRLGFVLVPDGGFLRDGKDDVVLLKYYGCPARYIKEEHATMKGADDNGNQSSKSENAGRPGSDADGGK